MLYIVEDEKGELVTIKNGEGAIFLTEAEAIKLMTGRPKWVLHTLGRIWP